MRAGARRRRATCRCADTSAIGEPLMASIATRDSRLRGQPLDDVLRWSRPPVPAGCYCEADSRQHKWGLVLETIHYALARQDATEQRMKKRCWKHPGTAAARRRRDGHAVDARRTRAGQLRRSVEPDAPRTRARPSSAATREAGSDCILTNTFGGSRIMLNRHWQADDVAAINEAGGRDRARGVWRTRRLRDRRHRTVRRPDGALWRFHRGRRCGRPSSEQAQALVDAGADAIIIETQTSLEELLLAIEAAQGGRRAVRHRVDGVRRHAGRLDVPHDDGHRSRSAPPTSCRSTARDIVALNCGTGMDMERARQAVMRYRAGHRTCRSWRSRTPASRSSST